MTNKQDQEEDKGIFSDRLRYYLIKSQEYLLEIGGICIIARGVAKEDSSMIFGAMIYGAGKYFGKIVDRVDRTVAEDELKERISQLEKQLEGEQKC